MDLQRKERVFYISNLYGCKWLEIYRAILQWNIVTSNDHDINDLHAECRITYPVDGICYGRYLDRSDDFAAPDIKPCMT